MMLQSLKKQLNKKKATHAYRRIADRHSPPSVEVLYAGKPCLSFCSNDYLGLANHPRVTKAFKDAVDLYGVGSGGSFLVSGTCKAHIALQEALADFMGYPRALLFSNGYMANLGILTVLAKRSDTILYDRACHASLLDGVQLTRAHAIRYPHNDMDALNAELARLTDMSSLVVSNGVFSTTGELAPLPQLVQAAQDHKAWTMIDDTHGLGCLGKAGRGSLEHFAMAPCDINVLMSSFGKAFSTYGAFVAGDATLIDALEQMAYTRIFTTALPPAIAAATHESLRVMQDEPERRQRLQARIAYFSKRATELRLPLLDSVTAIQSISIGSNEIADKLSEKLIQQGLLIKSLRPPTVPQGCALLRLSLCADHTEAHIDHALNQIAAESAMITKNQS